MMLADAAAQATTVLSSGYVMPASGDAGDTFTYRVKYWNTANVPPDAVWVGIWRPTTHSVSWRGMWAYNPGDSNYTDGKWYTYHTYLRGGEHAHRFAAKVGGTWIYWPDPPGSYQPGPNVNPVVLSSGYVTPTSGSHSTNFTWRVKYWHTGDVAPDEVWCAIWWGSQGRAFWHPMWALDPSDTYYPDGKWYTQSMRWLDTSAHAYRFAARQGSNWAYWPKPTGSYVGGPEVGPPAAPWPVLGFSPSSATPEDIAIFGPSVAEATDYHLYQSADGVNWSPLAAPIDHYGSAWRFLVNDVADGTHFRVTAGDASGEGLPSESVVAWPSRVPGSVGSISTYPHSGDIEVSRTPVIIWDDPGGVRFYMVSVMPLVGATPQPDVYTALIGELESGGELGRAIIPFMLEFGQTSGPNIIWAVSSVSTLDPYSPYRLVIRAIHLDNFQYQSSGDQDFTTGGS